MPLSIVGKQDITTDVLTGDTRRRFEDPGLEEIQEVARIATSFVSIFVDISARLLILQSTSQASIRGIDG